MIIVDGKKIAENIKIEISSLLKEHGQKSLGIVYVGENSVIDKYVSLKKRVGEELGIRVEVLRFKEDILEGDLTDAIKKNMENFSGMIVQLPLPVHIEKEKILDLIPPEKDIDALSKESFRLLEKGEGKLPPVVGAIDEIVKEYGIDLANKKIFIVGRGALVGRPVEAWLSSKGINFETLEREGDKGALTDADVIISGAGAPGIITKEMVKEGVILLDAGTSTSEGRLAGDIELSAYEKASIVSPVPGGIGPITVACLFRNLFL